MTIDRARFARDRHYQRQIIRELLAACREGDIDLDELIRDATVSAAERTRRMLMRIQFLGLAS